jgi:hypothetical protein
VNGLAKMKDDEWLEADGLGGFASGTVSGIRTRRYRALLICDSRIPTRASGDQVGAHLKCRADP